jgi:hypothetical protein
MEYSKMVLQKLKSKSTFRYILLLSLLSLFFIVGSCEESSSPKDEKYNWAIFLLKDNNINIQDIVNKDLSSLSLQSSPWLSDKDIDYYDYSSHFIYLIQDKSSFFSEYKTAYWDSVWSFRPFLIIADGVICYAGFFYGYESKYVDNTIPYIDGSVIQYYPTEVLEIERSFGIKKDVRDDERIKNALITANKIKFGIEVNLDSVKILNYDTTTVEYNITIKNNDNESIYVFDPDKSGIEIFSCYTMGIIFLNLDTQRDFSAIYRKMVSPSNPYTVNIDYYTKINIGGSITRKLLLKGFENIPYGEYYCQMRYCSPFFEIEEGQRTLNDGKIWIGYTLTNIMKITFDENNNCKINNRDVFFDE